MSAGHSKAAQTGAEAFQRFGAPAGSRYRVVDERIAFKFAYGGFVILDERGCLWDRFRTRSGAEYAARMLERGLATRNPHATIGCRVEVI